MSACWWKQSGWIRAYRRKQHNCSLSRIDSACQAHVFREGSGGVADIRVLGLCQMIDALIVLQVLKIPDTQGISFFFCLFFIIFSTSCGREAKSSGGERENWQLFRSKSISRHVSHNSEFTIHCSPVEHVEDMSSWCQIPSAAPDGWDAIDLAELGHVAQQ